MIFFYYSLWQDFGLDNRAALGCSGGQRWKINDPGNGKDFPTHYFYLTTNSISTSPLFQLPIFREDRFWIGAPPTSSFRNKEALYHYISQQGDITCGAIDEPRKFSKAIDERVIINFRNKNVVIARFRDKNGVIARFRDKNAFLFYP